VIYQCEVTNPEKYEEYRPLAAASIAGAGGTYRVRGGEIALLEGEMPPGRTVVVEFPDRQTALDWYNGTDYVAARQLRKDAAIARMYVVDGCDAQ